jgi:hypothetical protein
MALRLTCSRLMRTAVASGKSSTSTQLRSFAAQESPLAPGAPVPSVFDKIISLTIVDPSGARRKINGLVGESILNYIILYYF